MKADKETSGTKREIITVLKVAGTLAAAFGLVAGLFAAIEVRQVGFDAGLPLFSLALQLFFGGMLMIAASAGLDILAGLRDSLAGDGAEPNRYGRTRSDKGSILASKLGAEPAAQ